MQQACGDSPVKSADGVNAMPMPSPVSRSFSSAWVLRLTRGSAMPLPVAPGAGRVASRAAIAPSAAGAGIAQPAAPVAGSSAVMASVAPW
jgi:hypothetical protein